MSSVFKAASQKFLDFVKLQLAEWQAAHLTYDEADLIISSALDLLDKVYNLDDFDDFDDDENDLL